MEDQKNPVVKAAAAWVGVGSSKYLEAIGITNWSDLAAMLAAIYTLFLIIEWIYKKWNGR